MPAKPVEMPSSPLPVWIQVRLQTIKSQRELRRLLRTPLIAAQTNRAWREWAQPILPGQPRKKPKVIEIEKRRAANA
jgi:hypothetical protein